MAGLSACGDRFAELDPRPGFANLFGAHLEGREPPPGLDQPWPNLSSVPARPTTLDAASRERLSASLARDRAESRDPLAPAGRRPGVLPEGPPSPPRLVSAPAVRFEPPAPPGRPSPAALPAPAAPAAPQPARPATAPRPTEPPPAPAPELLAPPPPPSTDLFAPPPPPSRDLLAPRRD